MKYKNFAKAAVMDGLLCKDADGNNWLCHGNVAMKVPVSDRALYSAETAKALPDVVRDVVDGNVVDGTMLDMECVLDRAYLPEADSPAKDIIRVYATAFGELSLGISNADWALIEDDDELSIAYTIADDDSLLPVALLIRSYPDIPTEEFTLRGVIFPATAKED